MSHSSASEGHPPAKMQMKGESLSDTLGKIIHEFNGELFLLRSYADMAASQADDPNMVKKQMEKIEDRIEHLVSISQQLKQLRDRP